MARRYRRHPQTAGRVVDGRAFVVTADDQRLHELNETATHLWELASREGGCSLAEAVDSLVEHFREPGDGDSDDDGPPIDRDTAEADARECLDDLIDRRVLVLDAETDAESDEER